MNPFTSPKDAPVIRVEQMNVHIHGKPTLAPSLNAEERKYALILAFHYLGNDDRNVTDHRKRTAYRAVWGKKKAANDSGIVRNVFHDEVMEKWRS